MSFLQNQNHIAERLNIGHTWDTLRQGLTDIYDTIPLPRDRYMQLYNLVYQYCTSNNLTAPLHSRNYLPGCELLGGRLYKNLQGFLREYLGNLTLEGQENHDELLLAFYQSSWNSYIFSSVVTHHVFLYMNRHWIRRVLEDDNDVFEVYSLAMVMWRETLLAELESRVTEAVIHLITKERNGDTINTLLVSCIKQSYIDMGVSSQKQQKCSKLDYYKEHLESELLHETWHYYTVKSSAFLRENFVADYVKKALDHLLEEKGRVERYLHETSMEPMISLCKDVLIVQHLPKLYDEFQVYLDTDKDENMAALFELVGKTDNGLQEMQKIFEKHILRTGRDSIEGCLDEAITDSEVYVKAILQVYRKYKQLVLLSFNNHPLFSKALDTACQQFINHNAVTDRSSNKTNKSAELVARYCDYLLKKSSKLSEETELEDTMADIMIVFQYLESRDVFQKFYSSMLAKRLVEHLSMSEDAEASMISKLKAACGALYTSKLQKMFQDMAVNSDLNTDFMKHLEASNTNLGVDFHVDVLTQGSWPFQQIPLFALPGDLESCMDRFKMFYSVFHSGRKLIWLYHKSRAEIVTTCFKRRYTMSSSMHQVAVLLQYNHKTSFTIQELQENTQMTVADLQQVLRTLLKIRLLFCDYTAAASSSSFAAAATAAESEASVAEKDSELMLPLDAVCHLYQDYKNRKTRVNINVPLRSVEKRELEATHKSVDDERRYLIEAAIIRIMKTKQKLAHQDLVGQVMSQLAARFMVDSRAIKKCIDDLINRDYMKRCDDSPSTYQYVA